MERVNGTKTSVYTGCFTNDWQQLCFKDSEQCGATTALGSQACLNANRISWFFNFTGNSANIDTACSSSLVALDFGCKGLINGEVEMVGPWPHCPGSLTKWYLERSSRVQFDFLTGQHALPYKFEHAVSGRPMLQF